MPIQHCTAPTPSNANAMLHRNAVEAFWNLEKTNPKCRKTKCLVEKLRDRRTDIVFLGVIWFYLHDQCNSRRSCMACKKNEDSSQRCDNEVTSMSVTRSAWRHNRSNHSTVAGLAWYRPTPKRDFELEDKAN
ncbi:predicted protein [Botrytis cinerea T4]|uniref:Uncharacterized protein n=1 Tax=Botryotinia fuckeliana (strain T4) TaxID=999810 RepID=G2YHC2_BOTF4|nr:predicted protein [Botrytis cinerea T4]